MFDFDYLIYYHLFEFLYYFLNIYCNQYTQVITIGKYSKPMPSTLQESQDVCNFNMRFILQNSTKMLKDNQLIRSHLHNYANYQAHSTNTQLILQTGQIFEKKQKQNEERQPKAYEKKDPFCFRSVRCVKSATTSANKSRQQKIKNGLARRNNRQNSLSIYSKKKEKDESANKFIKLNNQNTQNNGQKLTRAKQQEINTEQKMRNNKINGDNSVINSQRLQERVKQKLELEKQKKQFFRKNLNRNKSASDDRHSVNFTTDQQGNIVFLAHQQHQKSIKKKYPPSAINFAVQHQQQPHLDNNDYLKIKQRAAKGQAFASAVLKTMNVSRISLNMGNTTNIDQYTYMKRNDLFNNNHTRQITTIPYMKVTQGTTYTQMHNNLSMSKKNTQRTYHSEMKSNFKTHRQRESSRQQNQIIYDNQNRKQLDEPYSNIKNRKRAQSCRPYKSKNNVPNTARTAGRITSFNKDLVCSLLQ